MTAPVAGSGNGPTSRLASGRGLTALLVACAVVLAMVAALAVGLVGPGGGGGAAAAPVVVPPSSMADAPTAFLRAYVERDGRVVRRDQGGDTVSEGQAYALLVAAATGDRRVFGLVWHWTATHLQEPDGLLAWHWAGGKVTGTEPATDADLGTAAALVIASGRFADPAYLAAASRMAGAILADETTVASGQPVLAAGPWATKPPPYVDDSYLSPPELQVLATAFGGEWTAIEASAGTDLAALTVGGTLPSDWSIVGSDGALHPTSPPSKPGGPVRYGYDAVRTPIWLASSCNPTERADAASLLPALRRGHGLVDLDLGGAPSPGSATPVGELALAAAESAAGVSDSAAIRAALAANRARPSYYGSAWLALTDLGLSHALAPC